MEDYIPEPTVVPASSFRAAEDANALRAAMKGLGTDEQTIVDILCKRSAKQRQLISQNYTEQFGRDIIDDLKGELGGSFESTVVALMFPTADYLAQEAHEAMSGAGTSEDVLVEILCTRTNKELKEIAEAYERLYGKSLADDIRGETSGNFERLLVVMLLGNRKEVGSVDGDKAKEDAEFLYNAGEGMSGTDEEAFNTILAHQSYRQLRLVFENYKDVAGKTIEQAIEDECSGSLQTGLLAIVETVQNRAAYFAKKLHEAMSGSGTDDNILIRIIVSRSEIDLANIKKEFERLYDKTLQSSLEDEVSGDYKSALLALFSGSD